MKKQRRSEAEALPFDVLISTLLRSALAVTRPKFWIELAATRKQILDELRELKLRREALDAMGDQIDRFRKKRLAMGEKDYWGWVASLDLVPDYEIKRILESQSEWAHRREKQPKAN